MRAGGWPLLLLTFTVATASTQGCARHPPPAPERVDAAVSPLPAPVTTPTSTAGGGALDNAGRDAGGERAPERGASAPDAGSAAADARDPGTLPQTRDKPSASGAAFDTRTRALWDGIVRDDPEAALPFFFPLGAYEQVKDVGSPASDWKHRLVAAYKRDIHALHEKLGSKASSAKLVRVDVPEARAKWVEPKEEYNKIGYWRVYGTRFVYDEGGKERTFDVSSLISWRGEWYVVHLSGFK